jgi:hypothetical protein
VLLSSADASVEAEVEADLSELLPELPAQAVSVQLRAARAVISAIIFFISVPPKKI